MAELFCERVVRAASVKCGPICLGLDPSYGWLHGFLKGESIRLNPKKFLLSFCQAAVDAADGLVGSIKFQSAFFEAHGASGMQALHDGIAYAADRGLFVILDAKRGDIGTTMAAYGQLAFDQMTADALTVSVYMGSACIAALEPWLAKGKGAFAVLISSNPEGQRLQLAQDSGVPHCQRVFDNLDRYLTDVQKSGLGFVVGVQGIRLMSEGLRTKLLPFPKLVPGVGAQGGDYGQPESTFVMQQQLGILPMSRSLTGLRREDAPALERLATWLGYKDFVRQRIEDDYRALMGQTAGKA